MEPVGLEPRLTSAVTDWIDELYKDQKRFDRVAARIDELSYVRSGAPDDVSSVVIDGDLHGLTVYPDGSTPVTLTYYIAIIDGLCVVVFLSVVTGSTASTLDDEAIAHARGMMTLVVNANHRARSF